MKPNSAPTHHYYAGLSRAMGIIEDCEVSATDAVDYWKEKIKLYKWPINKEPTASSISFNKELREKLELAGIYLSEIDLENDLANSKLQAVLFNYYGKKEVNTLVKAMQKKKADNMSCFLARNKTALGNLRDDKIMEPLQKLFVRVVERNYAE